MLGEPRELTFQPGMDNVVEYTYRLNNNPEQTVAASADGTTRVTVTPDQAGGNTVYVRSRTADNLPSGEVQYTLYPASIPTVTSVEYPIDTGTGAPAGTPGTFVFHPGMPGVTEYVYVIGGNDEQTVTAAPDGTASVTFTPEYADYYGITVYSRTASGLASEPFYGGFLAE